MLDSQGTHYVAKFNKENYPPEKYFHEVIMQAICQHYADLFNAYVCLHMHPWIWVDDVCPYHVTILCIFVCWD